MRNIIPVWARQGKAFAMRMRLIAAHKAHVAACDAIKAFAPPARHADLMRDADVALMLVVRQAAQLIPAL